MAKKPQSSSTSKKKPAKIATSEKRSEKMKVANFLTSRNGFFLILVIFFGVITLTFWYLLARPTPVAHYLPAHTTLLTAELNTDFDQPQWKNFFKMFQENQLLQKEYWQQYLKGYSGIDFQTQIQPWIGRQVGVAFLNDFTPIIFIESRSQSKALEFLSQLKLSGIEEKLEEGNEKGLETYAFQIGNGMTMTFFGKYLVIAPDIKTLKLLQSAQDENGGTLAETSQYQKVQSMLSSRNQAMLFVNAQALFQKTMGDTLDDQNPLNVLHPVLQVLQSQGWGMHMTESGVLIESALATQAPIVVFPESYKAQLMSVSPEESEMFYGGKNLRKEIDQIATLIGSSVAETLIKNEIKKWLNGAVTKDQLLELFQNEYAFTQKNGMTTLLLELKNPQEQEKVLSAALNGAQEARAMFEPKVQDGIMSGNATPLQRVKKQYRNIVVSGLEAEGSAWALYYAVMGNIAVISQSSSDLQRSIDLWLDQKGSLAQSENFQKQRQLIMGESDEVTFLSEDGYRNIIPEFLKKWLTGVKKAGIGWKYDQNGIKGTILLSPQ